MKTIVYVDGFNLYYGCLKGTPYRWLDLQTFAQKMLPKDQIVGIKYFTAKVSARLGKIDAPQDQASYFRALRTLPNLSIFFGRFLTSETWAYRVHPPRVAKEKVKVYRTEEKGSDVNLATNLLVDGYQEAYDLAVVVSNDGDLKAPVDTCEASSTSRSAFSTRARIEAARCRPRPFSRGRFTSPFERGVLGASQFPPTLSDADGSFSKPANWQAENRLLNALGPP